MWSRFAPAATACSQQAPQFHTQFRRKASAEGDASYVLAAADKSCSVVATGACAAASERARLFSASRAHRHHRFLHTAGLHALAAIGRRPSLAEGSLWPRVEDSTPPGQCKGEAVGGK